MYRKREHSISEGGDFRSSAIKSSKVFEQLNCAAKGSGVGSLDPSEALQILYPSGFEIEQDFR
jgi:hypothetical protein